MNTVRARALRSGVEGLIFAAIIVAAMMISGIVSSPSARVDSTLHGALDDLKSSFTADAGSISALNVWLAKEMSRTVERELASRGIAFSGLRDDSVALVEIQRKAVPHLLFAMAAAKCSGAYFFLFTTANSSEAPDALSGLYLKFDSILSQVTIDRNVKLFRGDPGLSRERNIGLHGAWEMQCDDEIAAELRRCAASGGDRPKLVPQPYFLSRPIALPGTWERVRLWGAPIIDASSGEVIGACGYEMSDMYFMHLYQRSGSAIFRIFDDGEGAATMKIDGTTYVRADQQVTVGSGAFASVFRLAALMPQTVIDAVSRRAAFELIGAFVLIAALIACAIFLARYLVTQQISRSIQEILSGSEERSPSVVPEIDDLWEFLASRDQQWAAELDMINARLAAASSQEDASISEEVTSAVDEFSGRLESLTPREREIFDLYLEGKNASEISESLFISYSTMKYHNRHIYSKLGVTSRRELLELIRLLQGQKKDSDA